MQASRYLCGLSYRLVIDGNLISRSSAMMHRRHVIAAEYSSMQSFESTGYEGRHSASKPVKPSLKTLSSAEWRRSDAIGYAALEAL